MSEHGQSIEPGALPPLTPASAIQVASDKVAAIVEAAETAAADLRAQTELRARERIAEADRAGALRVEAAEAEAAEILATARTQAKALAADAQRLRSEADAHKLIAFQEADEAATTVRQTAEAEGDAVRARAREDARVIVREAHETAQLVLREGNELSNNLRDLGASLQRNAGRLLGDVKLAHAALTADLDQAAPSSGSSAGPFVRDARRPSGGAGSPSPARDRVTVGDEQLDVPEFLPRR